MRLLRNASSGLLPTARSLNNYSTFKDLLVTTSANIPDANLATEPSSPLKAQETNFGSEEMRTVISASEHAITRSQSNRGQLLQTLQVAKLGDDSEKKKKRPKAKRTPNQPGASSYPHEDSSVLKGSDKLPSNAQLERTEDSWNSEGWKEGWGEDKLEPSSQSGQDDSSRKYRVTPPHIQCPLPYIRRVEGLLVPSEHPVLIDLSSTSIQQPIPRLTHGLDRVLFNPGVHWLQDPRSRVYNFTPWLEKLPSVKDFDFERLGGFIKSSRDEALWELAKREKRTFGGSTSSLTGILSHIYFLISNDRDVDTSTLSRHFQNEPKSFTQGQRMPTSVLLNYKDGVYAIDSDSNILAGKNVLTWMGTMLEKFLTVPQGQFRRLMRSHSHPAKEDIDVRREAYRYAKSAKFVMRSQLDCQDSRLPGTGIFDIKTRAALPIRLDLLNFEENSGYLIRTLHGSLESFEKEYYDLIRSAFLKYSFQARIGNMDGVFVAYHNTARMFGFQYIPLDDMEERLFGGKGRGERVFEKCVGVLESVADEIIHIFPKQSLKCVFETVEKKKEMNVWVEPAEWPGANKPIAQLDITSTSYLNQAQVSGNRAISAIDASWTIHWSVSRSSLSENDIRYGLAAAKERLFRAYNLPSGMGFDSMAEYWGRLNFGGKETASEAQPYDPHNFRMPGQTINMLRALARAGQQETTKLARETAGKKKVVWSETDDHEVAGDAATPRSDEISLQTADNSSVTDVLEVDDSAGSTSLHDVSLSNEQTSYQESDARSLCEESVVLPQVTGQSEGATQAREDGIEEMPAESSSYATSELPSLTGSESAVVTDVFTPWPNESSEDQPLLPESTEIDESDSISADEVNEIDPRLLPIEYPESARKAIGKHGSTPGP